MTIVGQVVRLEREGDEPEGTIGIRGKLADQDEERMIIVPLQPQDYERALRAMTAGWRWLAPASLSVAALT